MGCDYLDAKIGGMGFVMKNMKPVERQAFMLTLMGQLLAGDITEGQLLRTVRKQVLGLSQEQYAKLAKISRRSLSDLELGRGSPTVSLLNAVFRPLGLKVGLLPRNPALLNELLTAGQALGTGSADTREGR